MKYLLGFLVGILLGAACAFGLVYLNPLIVGSPAPAGPDSPMLRYSLDESHLLASTHNELVALPVVPADAPRLWESGIRGSWLQALALEDESGGLGAIATRLSVPSVRSNAIMAGLVTDDRWLITLPGRGILFAYGGSNIWPLLKDTALSVDILGREWAGPQRYGMLTSSGGGSAAVIGLSGEFIGLGGALSEVLAIEDYPGKGLAGLNAALDLDLANPDAPDSSGVAGLSEGAD